MVAGVAAVLLRRTARDHRRGDVASVGQEALADDPAVTVDVALAAGELLSRDQCAEGSRGLRTAWGPTSGASSAQILMRSSAELIRKVSPSTTRVTRPLKVATPPAAAAPAPL